MEREVSVGVTGLYDTDQAGERQSRLLRRTMIRYIILAYCIALRTISFRLKKRFPSLEHLVYVGVMTEPELAMFRRMDQRTLSNKWFLPLVWASKMVGSGLDQGYIHPPTASGLTQEILNIRERLQTLLSKIFLSLELNMKIKTLPGYDWLSLPLVYTQTVTIATYFYFAAALVGSQWVSPENPEMFKKMYGTPQLLSKLDLFLPFFTVIQFVFYVGWLKVTTPGVILTQLIGMSRWQRLLSVW